MPQTEDTVQWDSALLRVASDLVRTNTPPTPTLVIRERIR